MRHGPGVKPSSIALAAQTTLVLGACRVATPAQPVAPLEIPPLGPLREAPAPAPASLHLAEIGVDVDPIEGVRLGPGDPERQQLYLSKSCPSAAGDEPNFCISALVERRAGPAPATLEDARRVWNGLTNSHGAEAATIHDEGTTNGVHFTVRSHRVRVGFTSAGGTIHTWKTVSRVLAVRPIDETQHLTCEVWIEHDIESAADRDAARGKSLCTSMRVH
jgi:hypothetical protein